MIEKAKNKISPFRLMGFGHRVYKCYDPRALIVKNILIEYFKNHPNSEGKKLFESALKLEEKALKDEYFIKKKLFTNLDFFAGVLMYALGIPKNMFVAIFAQARSVGWIT